MKQLAKRYWGSPELREDAADFQKRNFKTARSMVRFQIVNGQKSLVISSSPSVFLAGSIHPYNTFQVFEEINQIRIENDESVYDIVLMPGDL